MRQTNTVFGVPPTLRRLVDKPEAEMLVLLSSFVLARRIDVVPVARPDNADYQIGRDQNLQQLFSSKTIALRIQRVPPA
jgi:hypothetical protein